MYDRSSRILTKPAEGTAPTVGPGTYHKSNQHRAEGYAPFQSMSVRESFLTIGEGVAAAPGPGYYSPLITYSGAKGGSSLHNKSKRFGSSSSVAPGPGTYSISSDWPLRVHPTASKDGIRPSQIKFKRKNNAPSIPSCGLNNGYEEDSHGILKPQAVPSPDCTLGPAYYNLPVGETTDYKGVHFGNLTSNRVVFKGNDGPGPSDYSLETIDSRKHDQTSSFVPSNIPRYHELVTKEENSKCVPGPGQYDLKSQFEAKLTGRKPTESDKAPFGSSLQRFLDEKQSSPACTTYQDPRTALTSIHRLHGMKRTPFGQSSQRFKVNQEALCIPGPGTYNDNYVVGMTPQLLRKLMSTGFNQGAFGTTSSRTVPLTKKDESETPGPTHYQDRKVKSNERPSHTFASTTDRLCSPHGDIPPPGSYEVSKAFIWTQGKMDSSAVNTGFLSTLERFAPPRDIALEEPDVSNPGPGEYDSANVRKNIGGVIGSEKPRLHNSKSRTPGPGAYDMAKARKDTVLRGTFNVTLVNPLKEIKEKKPTLSTRRQTSSVLIGV